VSGIFLHEIKWELALSVLKPQSPSVKEVNKKHSNAISMKIHPHLRFTVWDSDISKERSRARSIIRLNLSANYSNTTAAGLTQAKAATPAPIAKQNAWRHRDPSRRSQAGSAILRIGYVAMCLTRCTALQLARAANGLRSTVRLQPWVVA